jgi:hypothetical protein
MNKSELMQLEPGPDLDSLVATRIFGFAKVKLRSFERGRRGRIRLGKWESVWVDEESNQVSLPPFSRQVEYALLIPEVIQETCILKRTATGKYSAKIGATQAVLSLSPAESICKAALLWYEEQPDEIG